jgi:hypothetical protein
MKKKVQRYGNPLGTKHHIPSILQIKNPEAIY